MKAPCPRAAWLRRCLPGVIPVAVVSLCFAALHIRVAAPAEELPSVALVAAQAIGNLATIGLTVLWLRLGAGATLSDLGIVPGLWRKDVVIGLVAFAAVTAPILVFFAAIKQLAPTVVLDPLPIFLLAIVLDCSTTAPIASCRPSSCTRRSMRRACSIAPTAR